MRTYVGWAETNITPAKKISLTGQFIERISEYIEKPLTATALAVESGGEQMVLVSCDLVGVNWKLICGIRKALEGNQFGLDPQKVILTATHTHTGYSYGGGRRYDSTGVINNLRTTLEEFLKPGQKYVEKEKSSENPEISTEEENYALLIEKLPAVILEAWNNRKTGGFVNDFGRAAVGMCRRSLYSDETAQMWGDTNTATFLGMEGGSDTGIELLFTFDEEKMLTGIVLNLSCPAQCVQHRLFVSPDFWGEVRKLLRENLGEDIFVLCLCGPAGDQCPVDLVRWVEPESDIHDPNCTRNNPPKRKADPSMFDLAGMKKVGKRIVREVIDVWEECQDEIQVDVPFEHRVLELQLPIRRATLTDLNNAKKGIREYLSMKQGDVDYIDVANLQVHLGVLQRFEVQEVLDVLQTEVHIIRLGSIAIASSPFELYLDYGNQIRARSLAEQTFLLQLANGYEGYLPTEKAEKHGHYSAFIASGQVGHAGGEQLVRETLQNIRELFDNE